MHRSRFGSLSISIASLLGLVSAVVSAPMWSAWAVVAADITVRSKPFKIGSETFQVVQDQDFRGHVTREILVSPTYTEFTSSPKGNGENEIWEVAAPLKGLTVRARVPLHGKYSILEFEKKRRGGTLLLKFIYMPKRRLYQLTETRFTRDHRQLAQSLVLDSIDASGRFVPACVDPSGVQASAQEWLKTVQALSASGADAARQQLQCYLKRYQNAVFGPGCQGPDFASGMDQLRAGMVDVLLSAHQVPPPGADTYMQCLNDKGFSTHATRMEAGFANLEEQLKAAATSDPEMQAAKGNPAAIAALCNTASPISKLVGRSLPPIDCQKSDAASEAAEYIGGQTDQVVFHDTPKQILSDPGIAQSYESNPPTTSQQANLARNVYGSYFFHELLHRSQIDDETVVYALQNCCDGRPAADPGDCEKAQKIAGDQTVADTYDASFNQSITGYNELEANIQKGFGTDNAKGMLDAYFNGFNSHKVTAEKAYNQCVQATPSCGESCKDSCATGYVNEMAKFTKDFFNSPNYCGSYYSHAQDPNVISCAQIAQRFSGLIENSIAGSTPGRAEAAYQSLDSPSGNPTLGASNGTNPGASEVAQISDQANGGVTPSPGALAQAVSASSSSPPPLRLGDVSAATARNRRGTPILNTAEWMTQQVGKTILPRAYGDVESPETRAAPPLAPVSSPSGLTNEFGGSPDVTTALGSGAPPNLTGVSSLKPNAGGPVAAAQAAPSNAAGGGSGASSGGGSGGNAGSPLAADEVNDQKGSGRESGGARANDFSTSLPGTGVGRGLALVPDGAPTSKAISARDKSEQRLVFPSLSVARHVLTGEYNVAHQYLTGTRRVQVNMELIDLRIKVIDRDARTYGSTSAPEVYAYCSLTNRLALAGTCK